MEDKHNAAYKRAKRRVAALRGFYMHLLVYLIINGFFSLNVVAISFFEGFTWTDTIENFSFFSLWFFWGIGLLFHGIGVFNLNPFFSKDWEARKIQKIMDQEAQERQIFKSKE